MPSRRPIPLALLRRSFMCALLLPGIAAAQTTVRDPRVPQTQIITPGSIQIAPRDRVPVPQVGTASIKGRIVDGETGRALARVRVRLQGVTPRSPILSDADGNFSFAELPQGGYTVVAEKSTYMATRFPEPPRSLRNRNQSLVLRNGESREDLVVPMFRGGVIAGRVVDAHGDPIDNAQITLIWVPRSGRPTQRGGGQTNDLGEYRLPRLQPGRYMVRVRVQTMNASELVGRNATPLPQPLPAYFPGTLSPEQAQVIVVNKGETVSGIDFALPEGFPTVVSGIVLPPADQPQSVRPFNGGSVSARIAGPTDLGVQELGTGLNPDGTFRMLLPPGEYHIEARAMAPRVDGQPYRDEDQRFGSVRLAVSGPAIENVTIMIGQFRVPLSNIDGQLCRAPMATIAPDWSFKIDSLAGTCAMAQWNFGRWTVKSVTLRGRDITDDTITLESGQQYNNIQIVVTDRRMRVDLRVSDDAGQATSDFVGLVFPAEKARWSRLPQYMRTVSPAPPRPPVSDGRTVIPGDGMYFNPERVVRLDGMRAGDYYAIALDDIDSEDAFDPAILERLIGNAVRLTVSDVAPVEVPLRRMNLADILR